MNILESQILLNNSIVSNREEGYHLQFDQNIRTTMSGIGVYYKV